MSSHVIVNTLDIIDHNVFEVGYYKDLRRENVNMADATFDVDHMPPHSCIEKSDETTLKKKLLQGQDIRGPGYLPAMRIPTKIHRYLLSSGNSDEAKQFRNLVTRAISANRATDMIKFTLIGSSLEYDQRFFATLKGKDWRKAAQRRVFHEKNEKRYNERQPEAFQSYIGLMVEMNVIDSDDERNLRRWVNDVGYSDETDSHVKKVIETCS